MHNLTIEQTPIHVLQVQDRNARTHSKRQIRQIAKAIERFGFTNPILVDDHHKILAGHGRLAAAKLLKLPAIPTIKLSHMSETEKRAYVIADNELALKAGWDREILALELKALVDLGFEAELTGFETAEIDLILGDWQDANGSDCQQENHHPETEERAVSQSGDLWVIGEHRLLCGDCRRQDAYTDLLGTERADMVFTDPPYNVPIEGHVSGLGQKTHREFAMASGEMTEGEFKQFLIDVLQMAANASRNGALHYVCMDWRHLHEVLAVGRSVYSALVNLCVWNKDNGGMGSFYRSKHELVPVFKVGDAPHRNNVELGRHGRNRANVWDYAGVNTFRAGRADDLAMHPTVKPVALVADAIKDASERADIVVDPFSGSGTAIIAAEKTGRRCRAIEIDPQYVDVAIRRWQKYTGKSAYLAASSSTFDEVAESRSVIPQLNFEPASARV